MQNFANFYSYARSRHYTAKSALGSVLAAAQNMRVGFGAFGGKNDNINITELNESPLTGNKGALLDRLYRNDPASNSTPIRSSLEQTGRYFACESSRTIITSGATCPVLPAPEGNCQQNFALVVTAGFWNANGPSNSIGSDDSDGMDLDETNTNTPGAWDGGRYADTSAKTLADVAMYFYERDLHPNLSNEVPATEKDLAGAAASSFGSFSTVPTMHQHMSTYVIAFGVSGTISKSDVPNDYTQAFDWGDVLTDKGKLNDLVHASVNGRGEYLNASNPAELRVALDEAFRQFSQTIGTASAVSFNSQEVQAGALIYRAFYNIRNNTGDLVAQTFNADGTVGDEQWSSAARLDSQVFNDPVTLALTDNRQILTFDPTVSTGAGGKPFRAGSLNVAQQEALEDDVAGTVITGSDQFNKQIDKHVKYLRGDKSNERPVGNLRERPAVKGRLGDIVSSTPVYYGAPNRIRRNRPPYPTSVAPYPANGSETYETFAAAKANRRDMVYVGANDGMLHGFDADDGEEIFAFIPDLMITGFYSQRIKQLLSSNYVHRYAVDLAAAVNDVYMDVDARGLTSSTDENPKEWATILIGGYRGGGKGYFALDVTDPDQVTEANASNVVLWEFTDGDDLLQSDAGGLLVDVNGRAVSDLGYTYSQPTIAMSNVSDTSDTADNRWVAVFGNGYNSTSGRAALFVAFVDGGMDGTWCHPDKSAYNNACAAGEYDFVKLAVAEGNVGVGNGLGTPRAIDVDGNGTVDYAYAGDRFGNLFRFDLRNPDPSLWTSTLIYSTSYDNPNTLTIETEAQPITTKPLVVPHPTVKTGADCGAYDFTNNLVPNLCGGYIVVFSTGSYLYEDDDTSKSVQSIYGIWDRLGSTKVPKTDLVEQSFTAFTGDVNVGTGRTLSENPVDYGIGAGKKQGWYINFDHDPAGGPSDTSIPMDGINDPQYPGEKAIRNLQLRGGLVFVNSVIPKAVLSCTIEAGGAQTAFCPDSGTLLCQSSGGVFDVNSDGIINDLDLVGNTGSVDTNGDGTIDSSELYGNGKLVASTFFEDSVPTDSTFLGSDLITQLSDQTLLIKATDTSGGINTGRISWTRLSGN